MDKATLRSVARQERLRRYRSGDLDAARRRSEGLALAVLVRELLRDVPAGSVCAFAALPAEPDLEPALEVIKTAGREVFLPVAVGKELRWARDVGPRVAGAKGHGDLPAAGAVPSAVPGGAVPGAGVVEAGPISEDSALILVPALSVGADGARLGHGGGFYDRVLAHPPAAARVIAVVHPHEVLPSGVIPMESHDQWLSEVLTANGMQKLG